MCDRGFKSVRQVASFERPPGKSCEVAERETATCLTDLGHFARAPSRRRALAGAHLATSENGYLSNTFGTRLAKNVSWQVDDLPRNILGKSGAKSVIHVAVFGGRA